MTPSRLSIDFSAIRHRMADLPRAARIEPGTEIDSAAVYTPHNHRGAVDPERQLVVGNRGAGKSFWAHALLNEAVRIKVADTYRQPTLKKAKVVIGFNGAEKLDKVAPSPDQITDAIEKTFPPDIIWRTVLARAVAPHTDVRIPSRFSQALTWVKADVERYQELISQADDALVRSGQIMIIVFDALDRLPGDWKKIRGLTMALMKRALSIKSFRAIRFKVFMRPDQFADETLFNFPDASKIQNDRVALGWQPYDLYALLFHSLMRDLASNKALQVVAREVGAASIFSESPGNIGSEFPVSELGAIIDIIAGPFMGSDRRRGRVFTWVPTHLADAFGDCSPRTFLTAWRVAAAHNPAPEKKAVDHLGINEGVRQASSDRLTELSEDYRWVRTVLAPLKDASVPISREDLEEIWREDQTVDQVLREANSKKWLAPIEFEIASLMEPDNVKVLVKTLETIGVVEVRTNGKINVPDIFRVEAGIKRRGGVAVPRR